MQTSRGTVLPEFTAVQELFNTFLANDPDYSAQVAVYHNGQRVVHLNGGPHMSGDTITGTYSCSKGIAGMVMALLVQDGALDPEQPMAHYWPEFAAAGKGGILVREALSHQAGVTGVPGGIPLALLHTPEAAERLAAVEPMWRPGSGIFGYHALTIGILMEELSRRVTGLSLQENYDALLRIPYSLDFFLGLPHDQEFRYRDVLYDATDQWIDPLGYEGLNSNIAAGTIMELPNHRVVREGGMSAAGGVGSADGLARAYAAVSTGIRTPAGLAGPALDQDTLRTMTQEQVWGLDRSSAMDNAFAIVFMKPHPSRNFGSHRAFGHEGANASLGFADPAYGLSFGYIPQRAEEGRTEGRAHRLATAARRAAAELTGTVRS